MRPILLRITLKTQVMDAFVTEGGLQYSLPRFPDILIIAVYSKPGVQLELFPDVPNIITDILRHGAQLAIVSRNQSKAL
jgi:hypothetical protein